jgi:hypothetical protein
MSGKVTVDFSTEVTRDLIRFTRGWQRSERYFKFLGCRSEKRQNGTAALRSLM